MYYAVIGAVKVAGKFKDGKSWTGLRLCLASLPDVDAQPTDVKICKAVPDLSIPPDDTIIDPFYDEYGRIKGYDVIS